MQGYRVEVDLRDAAGSGDVPVPAFRSRSTIRFSSPSPGAATWVDTRARDITRAELNGRPLTDADRLPEGIRLPALAAENELSVDAVHTYAREGHGLHRFVDPADGTCYVYSHFQTTHARRAFACFDQPDLKAPYHLSLVVPHGWEAVSNTPLVAREELPDGAVRCTFQPTDPLSTYHIAFAAGPFARVDDSFPGSAGAVPLSLFCRRSLAGRLAAEDLFGQIKAGLGFFESRFGVPFPFPKLDVCFVPEFGAGAMENAGCITAVDDFLYGTQPTRNAVQRRDEMLLHEIAHMWFGNLVTLRWWDDLWLNEAFATWAALWAQSELGRHPDAWALFASTKKAWAYAQDRLASTHPVAFAVEDVEQAQAHFDYITYAKGAALIRQLVEYTGIEAFLAALRRYFEGHRYATATSADLLACLHEASGRDVHGWAERWLRTTGPGVLRADFATDGTGRFTRFRLVQDGPAHTHRPQKVAVGVYQPTADGSAGAALVRVDQVTVALEGAEVAVPALVGRSRGTLVLPNDADLGYCRVRLDPESVAGLRTHMAALRDPLARALCWSSLWDMVQDAALPARDFLQVVACGMATERQSGVLQRVLRQARTALTGYVDPQWATARGWPALTAALVDGVSGSHATPDQRLICCRALAEAQLEPQLLERVQEWCAGRALPDGLTLDADLRWRLLAALAAHGRLSATDLDAEAGADESTAAQARRERARAALPDAAAKEAAWRRAVLIADVPVALARAAATGFAPPGQRGALAPFARRYFADIPAVWRQRPAEQAGQLSRLLFPWWGAEDTVTAGAQHLLQAEVPAALHRIIEEARAEFSRAVALRRRDRALEASSA